MNFANLYWLAAAALALPAIYYLTRPKERVRVTAGGIFRSTLGSRLVSQIPFACQACAVVLIAVALCRPFVQVDEKTTGIVHGRDIILALDWSASMGEPYKGERKFKKRENWYDRTDRKPQAAPIEGEPSQSQNKELRRIDAAQDAIISFAEQRMADETGDRLALIAFDYQPLLRWKLDDDLKQITRHGSFLPVGKGPGGLGIGTNFGNDMPGPIDMAAEHFEKAGKSSTRVLILVTDGENEIKPEVMTRLADVIRKARMKIYVIGIGEKIGKGELDLEKLCTAQGGKVFRAESQQQLDKCFGEINTLESSAIPVAGDKFFEPAFTYFLAGAMIFYALGLLFEAVILGR